MLFRRTLNGWLVVVGHVLHDPTKNSGPIAAKFSPLPPRCRSVAVQVPSGKLCGREHGQTANAALGFARGQVMFPSENLQTTCIFYSGMYFSEQQNAIIRRQYMWVVLRRCLCLCVSLRPSTFEFSWTRAGMNPPPAVYCIISCHQGSIPFWRRDKSETIARS